ncbi:DUF7389 domain-containing protein [Halohasta salina]|uniref:DUF7389 domain-containing protein n=1 Tax=Halohasta salina TaxID=2961621 RepID=UPI0020A4F498|nr:hypothetical protein [Halohasta salina]
MSDENAFSITTELTRGTSTDDRDKIKATVEAEDMDELEARLDKIKQRLEGWAAEMRDIQPDNRGSGLHDEQTGLDEVEA